MSHSKQLRTIRSSPDLSQLPSKIEQIKNRIAKSKAINSNSSRSNIIGGSPTTHLQHKSTEHIHLNATKQQPSIAQNNCKSEIKHLQKQVTQLLLVFDAEYLKMIDEVSKAANTCIEQIKAYQKAIKQMLTNIKHQKLSATEKLIQVFIQKVGTTKKKIKANHNTSLDIQSLTKCKDKIALGLDFKNIPPIYSNVLLATNKVIDIYRKSLQELLPQPSQFPNKSPSKTSNLPTTSPPISKQAAQDPNSSQQFQMLLRNKFRRNQPSGLSQLKQEGNQLNSRSHFTDINQPSRIKRNPNIPSASTFIGVLHQQRILYQSTKHDLNL